MKLTYNQTKTDWVIIIANIDPKNIPQTKKKFMHDPDFSIKFFGISFKANEKITEVLNPLLRENRII